MDTTAKYSGRSEAALFVLVTKALHKRVRIQAAIEDRSLSDLVREAVTTYLDSAEPKR